MLPEKRAVGAEGEGQVAEDAQSKKPKIESSSNAALAPSAGENDQRQMQEIGGKGNGSRSAPDIDEDLHSRQLAVYGRETMRKLFASNVLISGLNGLGAEIAKNIVLAGVKSITLHDVENVEMWDLSSNFLLAEEDIGKNRAVACVQELQKLNNAVLVSAITEELSEENLSDFQAVVFTDISLDKAITFDNYCHNHQPPISFIKAEVCGLFGSIFCDFGPRFTVFDVNGEEPQEGIIASINKGDPTTVICIDNERLGFQDGDFVVFSEVKGMSELNDGTPRKINDVTSYMFTLEEDSTHFGAYLKGGIVTEVKQPKVLQFKPLRDALKDPGEFLLSDFSKIDRQPLLHLAFQALDKFKHDFRRYPVAGSEEDAKRLINFVLCINESSGNGMPEKIDKILLSHFANGSRAVLNPMAALFGGIVGQEVVKSCTGKFHPLFQFFYFDSVESLPVEPLEVNDVKPLNSRYDAQISVFGSKLQKKLGDANVFIVGAGALGSEFLKNLALMGVSCTRNGKLTITDHDMIAKSNLSRQFLFRDWNIGQAKSTVAASAAAAINPSLNIKALQNRACPETENVFNDAFWNSLDVIINALDNVSTRIYMDTRCVYFQKPLLESGTLGTKCSTQMIIPYITENYGASRDPPEKEAPICTIHNFPHNINHCLTWACSEFEDLLENMPKKVNSFLSDPSEYASSMRKLGNAEATILPKDVVECLEEWCDTFQDCVKWARLKFECYFSNRIKQLTYWDPEDATTSSGIAFWSAPRRFPHPLQFSSNDPVHLQFIMSASILRAETFRVPIPDWAKNTTKLADAVDNVPVPEFQPKEEAGTVADNHTASINDLIAKLEGCGKKLPTGFQMKPIRCDKDDDTNWHMDLISSLANLRARNYSIPEVDKLKAKLIAGRIIPAIATSTAMATGLVCLELYKVLSGGHLLRHYRNTFANLAIPLFLMAEPLPAKIIKHKMRWNLWHRWTREGDLTLKDLLDWLAEKDLYGLTVSFGSTLLYSNEGNHEHRLEKKVADLVKEVANFQVPSYRRHVDVTVICEDTMANNVEIPLISIYFR